MMDLSAGPSRARCPQLLSYRIRSSETRQTLTNGRLLFHSPAMVKRQPCQASGGQRRRGWHLAVCFWRAGSVPVTSAGGGRSGFFTNWEGARGRREKVICPPSPLYQHEPKILTRLASRLDPPPLYFNHSSTYLASSIPLEHLSSPKVALGSRALLVAAPSLPP